MSSFTDLLYLQMQVMSTLGAHFFCHVNLIFPAEAGLFVCGLGGGVARAGAGAASTVVMMLVPITVFVVSQSSIIETMGSSGMKD